MVDNKEHEQGIRVGGDQEQGEDVFCFHGNVVRNIEAAHRLDNKEQEFQMDTQF